MARWYHSPGLLLALSAFGCAMQPASPGEAGGVETVRASGQALSTIPSPALLIGAKGTTTQAAQAVPNITIFGGLVVDDDPENDPAGAGPRPIPWTPQPDTSHPVGGGSAAAPQGTSQPGI